MNFQSYGVSALRASFSAFFFRSASTYSGVFSFLGTNGLSLKASLPTNRGLDSDFLNYSYLDFSGASNLTFSSSSFFLLGTGSYRSNGFY